MQFARLVKIGLLSTALAALSTETFAFDAIATIALNVRSGPGTGYTVVDTLNKGEVVDVIECRTNGWCYVNHSGPDGWSSAKYLAQSGPAPSKSSANDAAAAAAFLIFLGVTGAIIGNAMQKNNPPPPPPKCPPGQVWKPALNKCVLTGPFINFCPPGSSWSPFLKKCL